MRGRSESLGNASGERKRPASSETRRGRVRRSIVPFERTLSCVTQLLGIASRDIRDRRCHEPESPAGLTSVRRLRSSLTAFAAVLDRRAVGETGAPFNPPGTARPHHTPPQPTALLGRPSAFLRCSSLARCPLRAPRRCSARSASVRQAIGRERVRAPRGRGLATWGRAGGAVWGGTERGVTLGDGTTLKHRSERGTTERGAQSGRTDRSVAGLSNVRC